MFQTAGTRRSPRGIGSRVAGPGMERVKSRMPCSSGLDAGHLVVQTSSERGGLDRGQHPGPPLAGQGGEVGHGPRLHVRVKKLPVRAVQPHEQHRPALSHGAGDLRDNWRISGTGSGDRIRTAGGEPGGPGGGRRGGHGVGI